MVTLQRFMFQSFRNEHQFHYEQLVHNNFAYVLWPKVYLNCKVHLSLNINVFIAYFQYPTMETKVRDLVGLCKHQNNHETKMVVQASHLFRPIISPKPVTINIPKWISKFKLEFQSKVSQPWVDVTNRNSPKCNHCICDYMWLVVVCN